MYNIHYLPKPRPRVHTCGCGSQTFFLSGDGSVVCTSCRYTIETLRVETVNKDASKHS